MTTIEYLTDWFAERIMKHSDVTAAKPLSSGYVRVERRNHGPVTVAPVSVSRLDATTVDAILSHGVPTVICLIPKDSHYDWDARERAERSASTVHTMKELMSALSRADPRPFVNKDVAYARDRLAQHSRVEEVRMLCESAIQLTRSGLGSIVVAVEYEYEFSEEALVRALKRHPNSDAVLNANPNGRPTTSALDHARQAGVGLFSLGELMGALNYEGSAFRDYRARRTPRN